MCNVYNPIDCSSSVEVSQLEGGVVQEKNKESIGVCSSVEVIFRELVKFEIRLRESFLLCTEYS